MTADFSQRYALIALPVVCLAAGLTFARPDPAAATVPAATGAAPETVPEPGAPAQPSVLSPLRRLLHMSRTHAE
jgi:hypothetical protein